mgnify:CR=1 FL=1
MVKMNKLHYDKWEEFQEGKNNSLTKEEQELLARLHSIYFKHTYHLPCTCSPKIYNNWIQDINGLYNNGQ